MKLSKDLDILVFENIIREFEITSSVETLGNELHLKIDVESLLKEVNKGIKELASTFRDDANLGYRDSVHRQTHIEDMDVHIHFDKHTIKAERQYEARTYNEDRGFKLVACKK